MRKPGRGSQEFELDILPNELAAQLSAERAGAGLDSWCASLRAEAQDKLASIAGLNPEAADSEIDGVVATGEYGESAALESLVIMLRMVERTARAAELRNELSKDTTASE